MRVLKTLLYVILAIVVVLVILGFVGPKSFDISRNIAIDAPADAVMPYMTSLKKQAEWSPWAKMDTTMVVTYEGEDGKVGSSSSWEGKTMGKGEQRIASIQGTTVENELTFYMPWGASKSIGYIHAAPAGNGSEVTWGIRGKNSFIERIMGVFMNMDKSIGPMFDQGLQELKKQVEENAAKATPGFQIQVVDFPGKQYVGKKQVVAMKDMEAFMGQHFSRIYEALSNAKLEMDGPPTSLYFTWDETGASSEMAAAIPVKTPAAIPDTEVIPIAAGKALLLDYYGPYDNLGAAHGAIDEYIKANNLKTKAPAIEEYVTDPESEPDQSKWQTKIYYLLDQ